MAWHLLPLRGMRFFACLLLVVCGAVQAALAPLTPRDISLMLRSGYSSGAVEQEVARRFFVGYADSAAEKMVADAGATPQLLKVLRDGKYKVPPGLAVAPGQDEAAMAARKQAMREEAQKHNTLYQDTVARERASAAALARASTGSEAIVGHLRGDLVRSTNGTLTSVLDDAVARKKIFALYFSALWCGPCRRFTPQLVEYYNRVAPQHPDFEVIFVSGDRSAGAMEKYMREMKMPWPAVAFPKVAEKTGLLRYAGEGIPCLVVVDANGRVLSDSYQDGKYVGPERVLAELDAFFARGGVDLALKH